MDNPLLILGSTADGRPVLGGAFQMADTHGFPLVFQLDKAKEQNAVISWAHYFASAMEAGWDDNQTFGKIAEALQDCGQARELPGIKDKCAGMLLCMARQFPGKPANELGGLMREYLEQH